MQSGTVNESVKVTKSEFRVANVTFPKAFSKTPKVLVQITDSDIGERFLENYFQSCVAQDISTEGFTIVIFNDFFEGMRISATCVFDWCAYEE